MKKILLLILTSLVLMCLLSGCKDSVTKDEALATAEKFTKLILTSDSEKFEKLRETEFYKEAPKYGYEFGYETLFMYLPDYTDICSSDVLDSLGRDNGLNAFIVDEYAQRHGYESIIPEEIKTSVYDENEDVYNIRVDLVLNQKKGDKEKKTSFSLHVEILHNEDSYYGAEPGDIVEYITYEHLLLN